MSISMIRCAKVVVPSRPPWASSGPPARWAAEIGLSCGFFGRNRRRRLLRRDARAWPHTCVPVAHPAPIRTPCGPARSPRASCQDASPNRGPVAADSPERPVFLGILRLASPAGSRPRGAGRRTARRSQWGGAVSALPGDGTGGEHRGTERRRRTPTEVERLVLDRQHGVDAAGRPAARAVDPRAAALSVRRGRLGAQLRDGQLVRPARQPRSVPRTDRGARLRDVGRRGGLRPLRTGEPPPQARPRRGADPPARHRPGADEQLGRAAHHAAAAVGDHRPDPVRRDAGAGAAAARCSSRAWRRRRWTRWRCGSRICAGCRCPRR